ncbi:hypothetical protein GYA25_00815 [Candidatus Woesearchaeota archaeon]|jgi:hypothetical protein|nr:hypothetical protein [Candidatus Woesearchaeota archaeon]
MKTKKEDLNKNLDINSEKRKEKTKENKEENTEEKTEEKSISKNKLKFKEKSKIGKSNRAKGQKFEAQVRKNLEDLGWIVDKWTNTVDYEKNKLVPAKRKYNPFLKVLSIGTGFPDFICFRKKSLDNYEIIGLEVKANGYLDPIERGMCFWLLENKIFSRILIARKNKKDSNSNSKQNSFNSNLKIEYIDFLEKYKKE